MSIVDSTASPTICRKCGTAYSRLKGYFPVSYSFLYKGVGYLPYCNDCIDAMYESYVSDGASPTEAVRQVCRKLDIYWSEKLFKDSERMSAARSVMRSYIAKTNTTKYVGKCYDDTLREEGVLWVWPLQYGEVDILKPRTVEEEPEEKEEEIDVDPEIIAFWGPGNTPKMYQELQQRYLYWKEHLPAGVATDDIGVQALLRQICSVEIELNKLRAAGKSTDKAVNSLNTLLGSAMLKPAQKKDEADAAIDNTPFGVWIRRWEDGKPIPKPDPELEDVDGIKKYVFTWLHGHLCKMLGIKNSYSRMYDEAIAEMRVERPEFDEEDDESFIYDVFSENGEDV